MRVAVVSDIHANLQALEAVAKDAQEQAADEVWCLGDVVGYGGNPSETLRWTEAHATLLVKGNHDEAVAAGDIEWFNPVAAQAARAHAQFLTPPERARIFAWPRHATRAIQGQDVLLVHASPDDPLREYVQPEDAANALIRWRGRAGIILLGHTHRPFLATYRPRGAAGGWDARGFLRHHAQDGDTPLMIVNPGSVGQPRDGDPRASYCILDFDARRAQLRRVAYDIDSASQAILRAGLDRSLAMRLHHGR